MALVERRGSSDDEMLRLDYVDISSHKHVKDGTLPLQDEGATLETPDRKAVVGREQDTTDMTLSTDGDSAKVGTIVEVKTLYASPNRFCGCCRNWDDEKPADAYGHEEQQRKEKAREEFAILKHLDRHGRDKWKTHSIEIKSKHIRAGLSRVFEDYPNVDLHALKLKFNPPFLPFIHRWQRFLDVCENEAEETAKAHLLLLRELLRPETEEAFNVLKKIEETQHASFENLNLIYHVGEVVVNTLLEDASAGILRDVNTRSSQGGSRYYELTVDMVDWDGERFGVGTETWVQKDYKGSTKVADLTVSPLKHYPDPQLLRASLVKRGRKFESLRGQHLLKYSGTATVLGDKSRNNGRMVSEMPYMSQWPSCVPLSEKIIVDTATFHTLRGEFPRSLRPLSELAVRIKSDTSTCAYRDSDRFDYEPLMPLPRSSAPPLGNYASNDIATIGAMARDIHSGVEGENPQELKPLSDDECFFTVPLVKGFALQSKRWCEFEVSSVHEITWNSAVLDQLVLGDNEKRLLSAMVAPKDLQNDIFDDFIEGKGKGMVILLCGPPGVGKTLTAESLAEHLRRPLYRVGASDLGSTVSMVEERLTDILLRCAAWDAMLLIDEADVFLEARAANSLKRNELVSSFLRLLEYYTGILILTTNRVSTLDTAFESRIDITLSYDNLSEAGRAKMWNRFLKSLPSEEVRVSSTDLAILAKEPLNGRQIKSIVKTARILARSEGRALGKQDLEIVVRLREKSQALAGVQ